MSSCLHLQITSKAYTVFVAQPGRRFIIAMSVANRLFRIHLFDRSGVVHSHGYNIHFHPQLFISILAFLTLGRPEHLSYDPTLCYSTIISRMDAKHLRTRPTIRVSDRTFTIIYLLFYSKMIRGRATLCFVMEDNQKRRYVVKDSWIHMGRVTTEEQVLKRIKEWNITRVFVQKRVYHHLTRIPPWPAH